MTSRFYMYL